MRVLVAFLLCALAVTGAWAQSTAQVSGSVRDQSGAVLPGVEVTVTQTDTGLTRTAVTDETGSYAMPSLPIGPYRLEATLPGFRTYVQTGIVLQVNSNPTINAVLEVGQVAETVEVQADAALVETRSTGIATLLDNQRVLELPLNGRNVAELVLLSGIANTSSVNKLDSQGSRSYPALVISIGGGMENGINYMLDGGNHNDPGVALNLPMPFPDALQEFKVETSGLPAQYGLHSSGAVNAVTKSGTNEFHGSLFEFVRNGSLNARNAFALDNDGLKRNQFGGTIGGPVLRNKLFFFAGYQGTLQRSRPSTQRSFIPTAAMIAGDFTAVTSAACNNGRPVTLNLPFVNNMVNPALFSRVALNLVRHPLFPTTNDPCGEVQYGRRVSVDEHITIGKMDYQLSEKHSLFGRYMEARRSIPTDFDGTNILSLSDGIVDQPVYSLVLGDTYLIGSEIVSSFRGTLNRMKTEKYPPDTFDLTELGVRGIFESVPKYPRMSVSNGFALSGSRPNPGHYNGVGYQLSEDLSILRGSHQIGVGANFIHYNFNGNSGVQRTFAPSFNGMFTGRGTADFLLGRVSSFNQGSETVSNSRQHYVGIYLQDAWKATPGLTVNAGIRWEPYLAPYNHRGVTAHFDKAAFDQGIKSKVFKNAPAGLLYPGLGDPGFQSKSYFRNRMLNFAPRLGLAWDPTGNGRMTVRAAYGIFFDMSHLYNFQGAGVAPPYGNLISIQSPQGGIEDPWLGYPGGNPFPVLASPDVQFPNQFAMVSYKTDMKVPYVHQWNLSFQRQFGTDWMVSGNYIGNSQLHLYGMLQTNQPILTPGATLANINQRRVLYLQNPVEGRYYGAIGELDDGGTSHYNAMFLSVQRRASGGLTMQGNYTLSSCFGDEPYPVGADTDGTYPNTRKDQRGPCPGDLRHNFNMSTVYQTPQFGNAALRAVASDWQVSGIVRLQSGSYFTVTSGFDTALTGTLNSSRADQVLDDPYVPNKGIDQWLNRAAFARPANGNWGYASKKIQGPGSIGITMGLTRTFQIREAQSLQFRAEAFNLPNHLNPENPINALNDQNFGRILSAEDPRIIQLALKYVF